MGKYTEDELWEIVEDLEWKNAKSQKRYHITISKKLIKKYFYDIEEIQIFVRSKRKQIKDFLKEWQNEQNSRFNNHYHLGSDDGFWDLTAHIVGLGKKVYNSVLIHPKKASDMALEHNYVENFEYSFEMKHNDELTELYKQQKKLEERKRKLNNNIKN